MSARFSQSHGIVPVESPLALNYNTGMTMDSVSMGKYGHGTLIIMGSADCAGAGILTMMAGATDAAVTAAITFTYRISSADVDSATADVYSAPTTSAALTFVEASIVSGVYVIEWDVEDMNVSGVQYTYMTPVLSDAGTAGIISAVIILSEPRYEKDIMPTAIPTA